MNTASQVFSYRLDLYWRTLAVYAVALLLYGFGRSIVAGTIQSDGKIEVVIEDPIFWLLAIFVVVSGFSLAAAMLLQRRIIIEPDAIVFATRFRQHRLERTQVRRIIIRRERSGWRYLRSVRIYAYGRRFPIRLRPSFYDRERELIEGLLQFRPPTASRGERVQ
ncbi:MAG: hypothetical protein RML15_05030 [Bacteroidota bacterium]|nr:hypothetical protein [Candidatus Kapabacteria bacterium]MCS7303363.1 hypothetical protein [Candidatus Kapabacteria bacterium]MCX7937303.1 hypothetical protein [Chlorobiota bacterium]MDW8075565.1 hypothetical protein [Bacteroidota bacterium]MDW8271756.1 hypothetical protein [Bacteroidota bacterium]